MINKNELRVGNWVKLASGDITDIRSGKDIEFASIGAFPIPLTDEWLTKLGFKGRHDNAVFQKENIIFSMYETTGANFEENGIHVNVRYVHQLQNLYFALTEEELKI